MVVERVPGQVGEDPVVLVAVVAVMSEDDVRIERRPDLLEPILNPAPLTREITLPEGAEPYLPPGNPG